SAGRYTGQGRPAACGILGSGAALARSRVERVSVAQADLMYARTAPTRAGVRRSASCAEPRTAPAATMEARTRERGRASMGNSIALSIGHVPTTMRVREEPDLRIVDIREHTAPIAAAVRNAAIDFTSMTVSLVAIVTDVVRAGRRVVGYGFNSN